MTPKEAKALYQAGKIRAIWEELSKELRALDADALESYLAHPSPDFAYHESCKLAIKLAREQQEAMKLALEEEATK